MQALVQHKEKAITLRKKGLTYNEILKQIPVAKSSLSLWLKNIPLTKSEKLVLKSRKDSRIDKGRIKVAGIMRNRRLRREQDQLEHAKSIFSEQVQRPLFHTGVALYWAEGGKRTNQWQFMNSDVVMIQIMVLWLTRFIGVAKSDIRFRLYVHKAYQSEGYEDWWAKKLSVDGTQFLKTIIKPSGLGIKKRPQYHGCLRIEIRSSKALLNQMRFWQKMIVEYYRKQ